MERGGKRFGDLKIGAIHQQLRQPKAALYYFEQTLPLWEELAERTQRSLYEGYLETVRKKIKAIRKEME